jgi:hypothetical protein
MKSALEVIEAARDLSSVAAAYVKPKDELSKGRGASATKILRKTRVAWLVARQARILAGETTGRPSSENSVATLTASA